MSQITRGIQRVNLPSSVKQLSHHLIPASCLFSRRPTRRHHQVCRCGAIQPLISHGAPKEALVDGTAVFVEHQSVGMG